METNTPDTERNILNKTERRVGDASSAQSTFTKLWNNRDAEREDLATVLAQLGGALPFSDTDLVSQGQGWRTNVNFRDASSSLEQVQVSYWKLVHDATKLAAVTIENQTPHAAKIQQAIENAFNKFVDDWGAPYVTEFLKLSFAHVGFGKGALMFNSLDSPRWKAQGVGKLIVPDGAPSNVDEWEICFTVGTTSVSELWEKIRTEENEAAAEAIGWDPAVIRRSLKIAIKSDRSSFSANDAIELEKELRTNSLGHSCSHGRIKEVSMFVKEFDGKISQYIWYPDLLPDDATKIPFVFDNFEVEGRPTSMLELLQVIFFEVGISGEFNDIKGFGVKNFDIANITNRVKSRAIDRTLVDGLNFRDVSDSAEGIPQITNLGPFNIFPRELEQIQHYPSGSTILDAIQILDSQSSFNNARYKDNAQQIGTTKTATQANILAGLQSQVEVSNATLYLNQMARVFDVQIHRMLRTDNDDPDAVKFRERIIEYGVPEEYLPEIKLRVKTGSSPGVASAQVRAQIARELLQFSGSPLIKPRKPFEAFISSTLGPEEVDRWLNVDGAVSQDDKEARTAMLENNAFGTGSELPVDQSDLHHVHLPIHLEAVERIVAAYEEEQTLNPDGLVALQVTLPHMMAHFQFLLQDAFQKDAAMAIKPRLSRIQSVVTGIMTRLEEANQQAQETGELSNNAQTIQA